MTQPASCVSSNIFGFAQLHREIPPGLLEIDARQAPGIVSFRENKKRATPAKTDIAQTSERRARGKKKENSPIRLDGVREAICNAILEVR